MKSKRAGIRKCGETTNSIQFASPFSVVGADDSGSFPANREHRHSQSRTLLEHTHLGLGRVL